jgi:multidrug efflux pump
MMAMKMEQGWDRIRAASFAYTHGLPMLTGTLVTAAGFLPIATAQVVGRRIHALDLPGGDDRAAGVVGRGVMFIPYMGYHLLPDPAGSHEENQLARPPDPHRPARRPPRRAGEPRCARRRGALQHAFLPASASSWMVRARIAGS